MFGLRISISVFRGSGGELHSAPSHACRRLKGMAATIARIASRVRRPSRLGALPVAALAALSFAVQAAQTTYAPRIEQRFMVNDNRILVPDPEETVVGAATDLRLVIESEGENWRARARPRIRVTQYTGDQDFDTDQYYLFASVERDFERGQFTQELDVSRTSTLTSELIDIGRNVIDRNRDAVSLTSSYTHYLNPRNSITGTFLFNNVVFQDVEQTNFSDYRYYSGSATYSYSFSPTTQWFASASYARFRSITNPSISKNVTYYAGISNQFDETLTASLSLGQVFGTVEFEDFLRFRDIIPGLPFPLSEQAFPDENGQLQPITRQTDGAGVFLNFSFEKTWDRATFSGSLVRQVQPSSLGAQRTSTIGEGQLIYRFSQQLRSILRVERNQAESESDDPTLGNVGLLNRDFLGIDFRTIFRINDEWQVIGQYFHRRQDREVLGIKAQGNLIGLALVFGSAPVTGQNLWY